MKDVEYYMKQSHPILIVEDPDEGGYAISFPDLIGCLSCAERPEDIIPMAMDAKRCWLEATLDMGQDVPEPCYTKGKAKFEPLYLRLKAPLYRALKRKAKKEGKSLRKYCLSLLEEGSK